MTCDIPIDHRNKTVRDYYSEDGDWNWHDLQNFLATRSLMFLASCIPLFIDGEDDVMVWNGSKDNRFSVSLAYNITQASTHDPLNKVWKAIWDWHGPQRIKTCLSLVVNENFMYNSER